jgi:preprotein translocase subunit SecE
MGVAQGREASMTGPDAQLPAETSRGGPPGSRNGGGSPDGAGSGGNLPAPPSRGEPSGFFTIYKPGQGAYVRWGTAVGAGIIAVSFAAFLSEQLRLVTDSQAVQYLAPVAVLVAMAILVFKYVGQNRTVADFLILTEREMKQVNWSSRREVIGHTKVVIFVLLALGFILFLVDVLFIWFFDTIGVLRIGLLERMFGGGGGE